MRNRLRPRATAIRDRGEFIGLLEDLVEHLYDHHAHLGVNTPSSPRLVPSGTDLWAAHRGGTALITQVRAGSDGERLRPGMEIVSIDGRPVAEAVEGRLPSALDREDPAARDWALRVLLADGRTPRFTSKCGRARGCDAWSSSRGWRTVPNHR